MSRLNNEDEKAKWEQIDSRRQFLIKFAALGASAIIPTNNLIAHPPGIDKNPSLIDLHHHILPPIYMTEARQRVIAQYQGPLPPAVANWTPENALAEMDQNNVVTAIISISTPGIYFGNVQSARNLARKCNEYSAQIVKKYSGRFGFFASVPLPDIQGALVEIEYSLDILGADGICLFTSYGNKWPGDSAFIPIFEELNRRKAIVYFHPTGPDCCIDLMTYVPYVVIELPHDTTRAITSLLFSGSLSRFQDIKFIFSHCGGTVPMLSGRIIRAATNRKDIAQRLPNGAEYELKRLFYDIAATANRPAFAALTSLVPQSQILFGSDYPYAPIDVTTHGLMNLGLSTADIHAIGYENAIGLFPQLKSSRK